MFKVCKNGSCDQKLLQFYTIQDCNAKFCSSNRSNIPDLPVITMSEPSTSSEKTLSATSVPPESDFLCMGNLSPGSPVSGSIPTLPDFGAISPNSTNDPGNNIPTFLLPGAENTSRNIPAILQAESTSIKNIPTILQQSEDQGANIPDLNAFRVEPEDESEISAVFKSSEEFSRGFENMSSVSSFMRETYENSTSKIMHSPEIITVNLDAMRL